MKEKTNQPQAARVMEGLLRLICFISLPLLLLFGMTILFSLLFTGGLNTNVNQAEGFLNVFVSFSLPMVLALGAIPLAVQLWLRKCSPHELGLSIPQKKAWRISCAVMAAGTAVLAAVLFWLGMRIAKQFESKKIRIIYCAAVFCWNLLFALWVMKAFMWL